MTSIDAHIAPKELQAYLHSKNWLHPKEIIQQVAIAGEGNMNVVLRIITDQRSFILKQSRPYVQKYQDIEAPLDRIHVEQLFYKTIDSEAMRPHTPSVLHYDAQNYLLQLQDLGKCEDMTLVYQQRSVSEQQQAQLIRIIHLVHTASAPQDFPENIILRKLNHQHIFVLPFQEDNGFDLDAIQNGLQELSMKYKQDHQLKAQIAAIGEHYLSKGNVLLHGDYYPGSWMSANDHIFVIDPEFSFVGFAEFDLGVLAGHLILTTGEDRILNLIENQYPLSVDSKLVRQMAGIEMMRRLIGLAQLPLERSISEKTILLQMAHKMILS
ncbi:phosphotransferase [Spongiimicrobium salis]|uniref:phosphotransferase n=1 Tax=Spongiimicrobium salis TaxID=1667022 RepID=UPI00374CC7BD